MIVVLEGFMCTYQARQRMGRAGREGPGHCYRLYTEEHFQGQFKGRRVTMFNQYYGVL